MLRSGAQAGDTIYVTGTLGDAAAGLSVIAIGADPATTRRTCSTGVTCDRRAQGGGR